MKYTLIKIFRILLFLTIGIFFLVLAFRDVQLNNLWRGLMSASYPWVLLSLLLATLAFISRSYRWILLIEPLGYKPSPKNTFYALMSGYLANFILPRIGEITRCGSLNQTERIPADSLLGTVITERISDLIVLILAAVTAILLKTELFGNFLHTYIFQPFYRRMLALLDFPWFIHILVISVVILFILFYRMFASQLSNYRIYSRMKKIVRNIADGVISVAYMKKNLHFLLHTIFIWLMYFLMTWALFMSLPVTAKLGASDALFIMVVGGLGMMAPVQGGIGTYHWIVSVGLGIYGISRQEGLVFATLSHESQALLMIILGSFSMYMVFISRKKAAKRDRNLDNSSG